MHLVIQRNGRISQTSEHHNDNRDFNLIAHSDLYDSQSVPKGMVKRKDSTFNARCTVHYARVTHLLLQLCHHKFKQSRMVLRSIEQLCVLVIDHCLNACLLPRNSSYSELKCVDILQTENKCPHCRWTEQREETDVRGK